MYTITWRCSRSLLMDIERDGYARHRVILRQCNAYSSFTGGLYFHLLLGANQSDFCICQYTFFLKIEMYSNKL